MFKTSLGDAVGFCPRYLSYLSRPGSVRGGGGPVLLGYEARWQTAAGGAGEPEVAASSGRSPVIGEVSKNKTPREKEVGFSKPIPRGLERDTIPLSPSLIIY